MRSRNGQRSMQSAGPEVAVGGGVVVADLAVGVGASVLPAKIGALGGTAPASGDDLVAHDAHSRHRAIAATKRRTTVACGRRCWVPRRIGG